MYKKDADPKRWRIVSRIAFVLNMAAKAKNKQRRRRAFEARHVDQAWKDMQKKAGTVCDGIRGPLGTTDK